MMKLIKYLFMVTCVSLAGMQNANAITTCTLPASVPVNYTVPLAPQNITVGPDIPNGTVIYRLNFNQPVIDGFVCSTPQGGSFSLPQRLDYTSLPMPLANWSGTPFPGKVYNTSVPGIGVVAWNDLSNQALPTVAFTTTSTGGDFSFWVRINTVLSFIKIGPVSPGVISGASLPKVHLDFAADPSVAGTSKRIYNLSYTGSINVVSQTCSTPDVNVSLGSYHVSKFTGKGSTTPWVDSSIVIRNCPRFYGYFNNSNFNTSAGAGSTAVGNAETNILSVSLTPQNAVLDSTRGIMALATSTDAAKGVGIQLGWGEATAAPNLVNFSQTQNYAMPNNTQTDFRFPLVARYYQTDSVVSPGKANGKLTFTINYY
ncbi:MULTISPECIES: fimbrial protein [Enterobacter]|uniref:fimbrial protein n=1 Tax=Enterobacter TaxID=547 RepID=UPI001F316BD8|nr:fimbrial protein [Enterobacter quasiroggenkampii]